MNSVRGSAIVAFCLMSGAGAALAHHGASVAYDPLQSVTVTGTVTAFRFVNPHVLIYFEVVAADGTRTVWSAGLTSPNRLMRNDNWSSDSLQVGDTVTVTGNPARNGAPSLWVEQVLDNVGRAMLSGR